MVKTAKTEHVIVAILAGGASRRMGGVNKATAPIAGEPMLAHVIKKVAPQADEIVISGPDDFGAGLCAIPDAPGAGAGPTAGLISIAEWLAGQRPEVDHFYTVPVDAPLLPEDLIDRLGATDGGAIARSPAGLQPTFARWPVTGLLTMVKRANDDNSPSLREVAAALGVNEIAFPDDTPFFNVNDPNDLETLKSHEF